MKIMTRGHTKNHGDKVLLNKKARHISADSDGTIRLAFTCNPNDVKDRAQHDLKIELSVVELAELLGCVAFKLRDHRQTLEPVAQVIAMMLCGGPHSEVALLWDWNGCERARRECAKDAGADVDLDADLAGDLEG